MGWAKIAVLGRHYTGLARNGPDRDESLPDFCHFVRVNISES